MEQAREVIEAMAAEAMEEAQRRIESQPPKLITVYGDDEAGTVPTPEQMEEARELAGPRDIIIAVSYTASDELDAITTATANDSSM